ncbi:MAG: hypothetical protein UW97_C0034G0002 [Parcubacteria group bacterium GW2011_GWA2_45_15]|nr:MAG: hypothetical protein UW97_C0034G0002 [Parcubacteria group bacterium GW2011_GWA2_45_15]
MQQKFFLNLVKIAFDTNLLLGEKTVRTAEGGAGFRTQNSLDQWSASRVLRTPV